MKSKVILSTLVLLLFALLGGGSLNEKEAVSFFCIILVVGMIILFSYLIVKTIKDNNKDKRLKMIKEDEANSTDFDRSIFIGDDRCKIYFDAYKKQAMLMRVTTEGITKEYVNDFEFPGKELASYSNAAFNIYDPLRRKLLSGSYNDKNIIYTVTDLRDKDENKDSVINNAIKPIFRTHRTNHVSASIAVTNERYYNILIDECHGLLAVTRAGNVTDVFNYIDSDSLSKKVGDKTTISTKSIGNYLFIMDDFFKVLVIISSGIHEIFKYSDIIEVSYEENGNQLYTKSAGRTIGGAIVGGVLMGGAGAVVGGLSGTSTQSKEIKNMDVKILLRDASRPSCVLHFKETAKILKTKEAQDRMLYETYIRNANTAKEVLSVIIDDAKRIAEVTSIQSSAFSSTFSAGIADEIAKLAKLKADGALTDEEFLTQKAKLLGV